MLRTIISLALALLLLPTAAGQAEETAVVTRAEAVVRDGGVLKADDVGKMEGYRAGESAWLQYRGDLQNSGVSHSRPIDWSRVEKAWSYFAGASLTATPAVAGGRVIAADELGVVHAIDAATGKGIWTRRCGAGGAGNGFVVSSPMILNNRIYVAAKTGVLYCLDWEKGEIQWEFAATEREDDGDTAKFFASPKGDARGILLSSTGGRTWCIDPVNGKPKWHVDLYRETGASAAVIGNLVYVAGKDRLLREIDYETGEVLRQIQMPGTTHSTPAIGLGYAFLITFQKTFAIDLTQMDAPVVWTGEATSDDKLCAAVGHGNVYFPLGQFVYAQEGPSGRTLWKFKAGHKVSPVCVVGDDICFAARDKVFTVVSKAGEKLYEIDLGEGFHAGPVVVDGSVYLASDVSTGVRVFCLREKAVDSGR